MSKSDAAGRWLADHGEPKPPLVSIHTSREVSYDKALPSEGGHDSLAGVLAAPETE